MLIPIKEWAAKNGLKGPNARRLAKEGRLKGAVNPFGHQWAVPDNAKIPEQYKRGVKPRKKAGV